MPLWGLSNQEFLRRHWQKKPMLVRAALPGFRGAIGRSALFALASRTEVESRLVQRTGKKWRVTHGPLPRSVLRRAGDRNWTLLVNDVNHHAPAAEALLRRFSFIPQARLDDVMVSYAAPGGGVGPHADSYDVFLIQGEGRRRWRLCRPRKFAMLPGAPLKIIAHFKPEVDVILESGDLLYLPPGWGHDGVALDACFTCSVGFRAPRGAELAAAFLDYLHERGLPDAAYRDPRLKAARHPAMIGPEMAAFAKGVLDRIRWNGADAIELLGRHLTTPKGNVVFRAHSGPNGSMVVLDPKTQLLYAGTRFFINGESFVPRSGQRQALRELADRRRAPRKAMVRAGLGTLLAEWRKAGYLA
jgi:50S ribosomal protein L16 3-hydroxylase